MLFSQPEFLIFFLIMFCSTWLLKNNELRKLILLCGSCYFYAYWDYRFLSILIFSTVIDYSLALKISSTSDPQRRRLLLTASLLSNFGILAFFKYFNFFIDSARPILTAIGFGPSNLNIILPIGISFYTFQTVSYTIDVYRGELRARKSLLDFALYVTFFPQLVAGPIVRASELLPQFEQTPEWSSSALYSGLQQFLRGAVKKVLVADHLAFIVDEIFANGEVYSGATVWLASVAYALQIYCDFSGYSDMAIGLARTLGYRFCNNFEHPYVAKSVQEFWRRWHISLSTWLRDYLYIPLGGNRHGKIRTGINLMLTMTLGGLWHGAAWTFVAWGVLHGAALLAHRHIFSGLTFRGRVATCMGWTGTMFVVLIGWVLFRSPTFNFASLMLKKMILFESGIDWFPPLILLLIALLVLEHLIYIRHRSIFELSPDKWYSPVVTAVMLWCLVLYPPDEFRPFVYFQF